ncbi:hypothetical protein F5Y15DRAFT_385408 [Xylariaceae sp. FL0016]|nr:hypothetical protein F5Y15DRAFT_385408 [Xylariaceae sp. FL0016]
MIRSETPPKFLIPARNSRHRFACLALYRALIRFAPRVQLPNDLADGWAGANPIKLQIQRTFRRNTADTSPRIVAPALKAGYHFLSELNTARVAPTSAAYSNIISHLRARLVERQRSKAVQERNQAKRRATALAQQEEADKSRRARDARLRKAARQPEGHDAPVPSPEHPFPPVVPLLVNTTPPPTPTNPFPKPSYAIPSRPRPQAALGGSGRRKIPVLDVASDHPFVRLTKPQPALMSHVLNAKVKRRIARTEAYMSMEGEDLDTAQDEDEWEMTVLRTLTEQYFEWDQLSRSPEAEQMWERHGNNLRPSEAKRMVGLELGEWAKSEEVDKSRAQELLRDMQNICRDIHSHATYKQSLFTHGIEHFRNFLTWEREDSIARADAMRGMIKKEKALAMQEKEARKAERLARWEKWMLETHGPSWREKLKKDGTSSSHLDDAMA